MKRLFALLLCCILCAPAFSISNIDIGSDYFTNYEGDIYAEDYIDYSGNPFSIPLNDAGITALNSKTYIERGAKIVHSSSTSTTGVYNYTTAGTLKLNSSNGKITSVTGTITTFVPGDYYWLVVYYIESGLDEVRIVSHHRIDPFNNRVIAKCFSLISNSKMLFLNQQ